MSQSTDSHIALAVIATALWISMLWIFTDISGDVTASSEPVWRYTSEGWKELADLTPPSPQGGSGLVDNVAPLVWAAIQLLAALAILIGFSEAPSKRQVAVEGNSLKVKVVDGRA
jgi:hypothetical protein